MISVSIFGYEDNIEFLVPFVMTVTLMTAWTGTIAILPAVLAIALAETFAWRSVLYYFLVGGIVGLMADQATNLYGNPDFYDQRTVVMVAAGFVGGFVYWLIAGRLAGTQPSVNPDRPREIDRS